MRYFFILLLFSACSSDIIHLPRNFLLPEGYQRDLVQGEILSEDKINLIKEGMDKQEVLAILGKPIVRLILDDSQWVYRYQAKVNNHKKQTLLQAVFDFKDDKLQTIVIKKVE